MPRARAPLTRSTLLETQRSMAFALEARDLLDKKREILLAELSAVAPEAEQARENLIQGLSDGYEKLGRARMDLGTDEVRRVALAAPGQPEIRITERSIVGAVVPVIDCATPDSRPRFSLAGIGVEMDRATIAFAGLIPAACRAAQTEATIVRLGREIRKTQRRVNALTNVVIPLQEAIIKEVREALEDAEREDFFRAKRLRRGRQSWGDNAAQDSLGKPSG